jgi:hypothetical protein
MRLSRTVGKFDGVGTSLAIGIRLTNVEAPGPRWSTSTPSRPSPPLLGLRKTYRERFQREGARPNLLTAVNHLFANPVTSIRELAEVLGVSFEAARRLVGSLEERGVLEEITGRRRSWV